MDVSNESTSSPTPTTTGTAVRPPAGVVTPPPMPTAAKEGAGTADALDVGANQGQRQPFATARLEVKNQVPPPSPAIPALTHVPEGPVPSPALEAGDEDAQGRAMMTEVERLWAARRSIYKSQGTLLVATMVLCCVTNVLPVYGFGEMVGPASTLEGLKWIGPGKDIMQP